MKVLIAVTHLLGAGHLTRAAAIGRALARAGHGVTLVSGGRPAPLVPTDGIRLVQLPPVAARVGEFAVLHGEFGGEFASTRDFARRRDMLLATFAELAPDIVVTELWPFGRRVLAAEFRALVEAARATRPRPLVAVSIRDILAQASSAAKLDATHDTLREFYDAILVHADPALAPLDASWRLAPDLESRVAYTGYVDAQDDPLPPARPDGSVLVSGGSSSASLPLYRAAIGAARLVPGRPWRILVGHGVADADHEALARSASGDARVERARLDFRELLGRAALFVGQAGYNTVVDLMRAGTPAVLVPFEAGGETEQRLRAERLTTLGLSAMLPEADLTADALARLVRERLAAPRPAPAAFRLDGAAETARIVARLAAGRDPHP